MKLIGIAGRAGSGKDPAAFIVAAAQQGRSLIYPLATGLKSMLAGYYGVAADSPLLYTAEGKASSSPKPLRPGNTVRQDLQQLGDATRAIDPGIWIRETISSAVGHGAKVVIIPDVRYRNELDMCHVCYWIGPDVPGDHPTENTLTSADVPEECRFNLGRGVLADLELMKEVLL